MKHSGFGAIDLLVGLLLISFIFIMCMKSFNGISSIKETSGHSVREEVDRQVNDIEQLREQSIDYQKQLMNNNNL